MQMETNKKYRDENTACKLSTLALYCLRERKKKSEEKSQKGEKK